MPTKKIADLPPLCRNPEHYPPQHMAYDDGIWQHTCPGCGAVTTFVIDKIMANDSSGEYGAWAIVTLHEASVGRGWIRHRVVGVHRRPTRDRAIQYARSRMLPGWRAAVIPWGDDLLLDGQLGSSPQLAERPRIIAALALDKHAPQFAVEAPDTLPNGFARGCTCGWSLPAAIWKDNAEIAYAAHVAEVFPTPLNPFPRSS